MSPLVPRPLALVSLHYNVPSVFKKTLKKKGKERYNSSIPMKSFVQYLIAFGLAFLIFMAIIITENTHFSFLASLQNPFEKAPNLPAKIENTENRVQEFLTPEGELWLIFPHAKLSFEGTRELISGEIFWGTEFLFHHKSASSQDTTSTQQPFLWDGAPPKSGQIKIGPLLVDGSLSDLFLVRDAQKAESKIYVFGHSALVRWAESLQPFVIPAKMMIRVREDKVTPRLNTLSYPELKRELQLKSFDLESALSAEEKNFAAGLERVDSWREKIRDFSLSAPKGWNRFSEDSTGGKLLAFVQNVQNKMGVGISSDVKAERKWKELVRPFALANVLVDDKKTALASYELEKFKQTLANSEWQTLLTQNLELQKLWDDYLRVHLAWTHTLLPDDAGEIFFDFWHQYFLSSARPLTKIFFGIEKLVSLKEYQKSAQELEKLKTELQQGTLSDEESLSVTSLRRILTELLNQEVFFQKKENFELYELFVQKELSLIGEGEYQNQIRLEMSQDVLLFLKIFLEEKDKIEISQVLLRIYNHLDVAKIFERLGRSVFTPEETEMINLISLIGSTGLTEEELASIKSERTYEKEVKEQLETLEEKNIAEEEAAAVQIESNQILNAKHLKMVLEDGGINVANMEFKTNRAQGTTEFSGGLWQGKTVAGVFHYPTQFFQTIRLGEDEQAQFPIRFLGRLLSGEDSSKTIPTQNTEEVFIPQNTPHAILERKLVQELLKTYNINVARENVRIQDQEMKRFQILKAELGEERYSLDFIYDRTSEKVQNLVIRYSAISLDFGAETFSLSEIISKAEEARKKWDEQIKKKNLQG